VEAVAAHLAPGERIVALYRSFAKPSHPHYERAAQKRAVQRLVGLAKAELIKAFDQKERLSRGHRYDERTELGEAIRYCAAQDTTLVIAVLGHLGASVLSQLAGSGIRFVACDRPDVSHATVTGLAAAAQRAKKTRIEALRANWNTAKAKGRTVNRKPGIEHEGVAANRMRAKIFDRDILMILERERARGFNVIQIAATLNKLGLRTRRGLSWSKENLHRIIRRARMRVPDPLIEVNADEAAAKPEAPPEADGRSGFAGRPTSREIVLEELRRRYAAGERHPSRLGGESGLAWAKILSEWLAAAYPKSPHMGVRAGRMVVAPWLRGDRV
jgi:DNA invertase Pin-like site-specific DNA recombinase